MNYPQNCIFIDESAFDINMRPSYRRAVRGAPATATTPSTRAESHTILGAICAVGVANVDVRVAQTNKRIKVAGGRKRKTTSTKKEKKKTGTTTGHYVKFLKETLNQLDKYPELKGVYIIMDNASIHTDGEIDRLITDRVYRCVYLPAYSPELNPIEQFWSIVKNTVKGSKFSDKEYLNTRISETCNGVLYMY